jgi:hypothetical protein
MRRSANDKPFQYDIEMIAQPDSGRQGFLTPEMLFLESLRPCLKMSVGCCIEKQESKSIKAFF